MGELIPRQSDVPADLEPAESAALRQALEIDFDDQLPRLASVWLMSKRSPHTRRAYARQFETWVRFCLARQTPVHPLRATRLDADAFMRALENSEMPATSVAHALSAASSFYRYAATLDDEGKLRNPFANIDRPKVDPDYSGTEGLTPEETAALIEAARLLSSRAYALVVALYTLGLRINEALAADVASLGQDRGHRTLTVVRKGGKLAKLPLPPITIDAFEEYLGERTDGPLFITRTGARMQEPEAFKLLRRLAKRIGLPQAESIHPHVLRHGFITDGLDQGVPLHVMQDAVGHKDPRTTQRYNTARRRLDGHPAYGVAAAISERLDHREQES